MPFVIRYPEKLPAGKRVKDLILNIDFAPTLVQFAGVNSVEGMQGRSFVDNLYGRTPENWRKSFYYRYWTHHTIRPAHMGIRNERYKLIFYYGDPLDMTDGQEAPTRPVWDFYDLQKDPKENHNVYNKKEYASIIKQMKKEMTKLRMEVDDIDGKYPQMQKLFDESF